MNAVTLLRKRSPQVLAVIIATAFVLGAGVALAADLLHWDTFLSLQGKWQRQVDAQTDTRLELQVKGNKMEYRFVSKRFPELSSLLHTYEWTALDEDTIRVRYDDEHWVDTDVAIKNRTMTFSPAVTLQENSETWHRAK